MSVYVDALVHAKQSKKWRWPRACHLMADTYEELVTFAESIGLESHWVQGDQKSLPHFDLNRSKREAAVRLGAEPIGMEKTVELIRKFRAQSGLE